MNLFDISDNEDNEVKIETEEIPDVWSNKWHDYVMGHFLEDELFNGNPTTDGLRRVANLLLGTILESKTKIIQAPNENNGGYATVEHTITLVSKHPSHYGKILSFTDVADVSPNNVKDQIYSKFPSATAATRAEGRALRKALMLKRVIAAEESYEVSFDLHKNKGNINNTQILGINSICKRNNINAERFIKEYMMEEDISSFEKMTHEQAIKLMSKLNELQRQEEADIQYLGYQPDWRKKV